MWTAPTCQVQQTVDPIACYQMSGLFARTKPAGRDGVRYARSKHMGDIAECQCNLRKLARNDRPVFPSTASCKFVGYPPSSLARRRRSRIR